MKIFHSVVVSVFIKEEEDYNLIKDKYLELFPFDLKKARVLFFVQSASTFNERQIKILEVRIEKEKFLNEFMNNILLKISKNDIKMMLDQIDTRVDENGDFFFRISKEKVIQNKPEYIIVDDGNCYHFKCHVAAYPQNKQNAINVVTNFLDNFLTKE
ncbi:MAG: RNA-binding domain-containing protein [Candidatus Woesearchaeota archaeon]